MILPSFAHKDKTTATLLAAAGGCIGLYRFYLGGKNDKAGWLHAISAPVSLLLHLINPDAPLLFVMAPLVISAFTGIIAALVIGTTSDEKWDALHNTHSQQHSVSRWPLALILVLTLGIVAGALISTIARTFDLLFTGGAYG